MPSARSWNRFLDGLPRTRMRAGGRDVPSFRACGVAGFYVAVIVLIAGTLVTGRSLPVAAALAAVCAASFFAWARVRRKLAGRESLVLLEHVWLAFACCAGALWLAGEPPLPYLDLVAAAMAFFLAFGRLGCLLAGCCHGHPSGFGIVYGEAARRDGFPPAFTGVRLFPVPALEALGLLLLGFSSLAALPFAAPGRVFLWFLVGYAVMRFGLERLRGDRRPHWLGLSQARWMALAEIFLAFRLALPGFSALWFGLAGAAAAGIVLHWRREPRRRLLALAHLAELRERLASFVRALPLEPAFHSSSRGASMAVSWAGASLPGAAHISLSLRAGATDLALLCELAVLAFPALMRHSVRLTSGRVLQFAVPVPSPPDPPPGAAGATLARTIYGDLFREPFPRPAPDAAPSPGAGRPAPWFFKAGDEG